MATIHVDGRRYEVDGADNLLEACLSLGLDIPYFCWHPALGSVGACRQCAVKQYQDEDDTQGALVMSCMTPAADGTRIAIGDDEAQAFRASVIEWLMIHHPHDCPVCEEGGHCHLQDMTVMTGHDRRRYRFRKRTHRNQNLGPFIAHEMNRCITCYRCVRFYRDYAGGEDLGAFGANDNIYFGRHRDGVLESPFSGNLTEVCPTGVFTDRTHSERYTRKWDLQFAPSLCHQCAVGCNISPGERYGEIRRIENRYHGDVNRFFLCDRGRFGYGYVNHDDRPRLPEWRADREEDGTTLEVDAALDRGGDRLRQAQRVIGIGSPRASLESNHQLRALVGEAAFSTGIAEDEQRCLALMQTLSETAGLPTPTLREVETHDAVLILGEDLLASAARLGLAVRQAAQACQTALAAEIDIPRWHDAAVRTLGQTRYHPVFSAYPTATALDDVTAARWALAPDDIARLGFAVAHEIDASAPAVTGLDPAMADAARNVAAHLLAAERPLVISGGSLGSTAILEAAGRVSRALARRARRGGLLLVRREANSTGLAMLGGRPLEWALDELAQRRADAVVILENDLYQRLPAACVDAALDAARSVVVLDHQRTATWDRAHLGLSAASFAEADGTLVSLEGRAQRFFQVFEPAYLRPESRIRESWRWLHALRADLGGQRAADTTLDAVTRACAEACPALAGIVAAAPDASARVHGLKLAREPHRYSGRTAMRAHLDVSEPGVAADPDSPFTFSMEGYQGSDLPREEVAFAWAPGWSSPQAWNKFTDEVGGHLRAGDPGVRLFAARDPGHGVPGDIPPAFRRREAAWQVVRLARLFGGEETSSRAAAIGERAAPLQLVLAAEDAARLGVSDDEPLRVTGERGSLILPVRRDARLPAGLVGVPDGASPELAGAAWVRLTPPRDGQAEEEGHA